MGTDFKKQSAVFAAAEKQLGDTRKKLDKAKLEFDRLCEEMDDVERYTSAALTNLRKLLSQLETSGSALGHYRQITLANSKKCVTTEALYSNLSKRTAEAQETLQTMANEAYEKEQIAKKSKNDKKAQFEFELAEKAYLKVEKSYIKLVDELHGTMEPRDVDLLLEGVDMAKVELKKYTAILQSLERAVTSHSPASIDKCMKDAEARLKNIRGEGLIN